jgi:hypothetical protein
MDNTLIQLAPTILGFLGGPAGGLAGAGLQWLAGKFGAKDTTVAAIKEALNGTKPEDLLALRKLDIEFQEFCMNNAIQVQLAQIEVNKEEAKNANWFVSGWRPAVGWIGAFGLGYAAILEPILRFAFSVYGYTGTYPVIDTSITMQVLFGILGLGAYRTFEKSKGVS